MARYEHPWQRMAPRWYEWSMNVREDWKAWLGFAIPMLVLTSIVTFAILFPIVWGVWLVVS